MASVAGLTALVVLVHSVRRQRLDSQWGWIVACWVAAGVVIAGYARVLTAGVIGANIGAGLFLPLPLAAAAVAAVVTAAVAGRAASRSPHAGPPLR